VFCFSVLYLLFAASISVADVNVMAINAEWLWTPKDGKPDGARVRIRDMSLSKYNQEIRYYSSLIGRTDTDVVALSEIENASVVEDLVTSLGHPWRGYFRQGRDTATGQDVALLSRLTLVEGSVTDFGFPAGRISRTDKGKRLSKVIGAVFVDRDSAQHIGVVTAHFLSRRNDNARKSANRLRQAQATLEALKQFDSTVGSIVVLGDFNDVHGSPTITRLREVGQLKSMIDHCAPGVKSEGGITPSTKRQIDHILFKGMACRGRAYFDLEEMSDHYAVWAHLKI